jgi:hypothetical protein
MCEVRGEDTFTGAGAEVVIFTTDASGATFTDDATSVVLDTAGAGETFNAEATLVTLIVETGADTLIGATIEAVVCGI